MLILQEFYLKYDKIYFLQFFLILSFADIQFGQFFLRFGKRIAQFAEGHRPFGDCFKYVNCFLCHRLQCCVVCRVLHLDEFALGRAGCRQRMVDDPVQRPHATVEPIEPFEHIHADLIPAQIHITGHDGGIVIVTVGDVFLPIQVENVGIEPERTAGDLEFGRIAPIQRLTDRNATPNVPGEFRHPVDLVRRVDIADVRHPTRVVPVQIQHFFRVFSYTFLYLF